MSYDDNPVYNPEKYGVEFVASGDISYVDYGFYIFGVVRNDEGYFLSTDSGCSCPSPWESHTMESFTGPMSADMVRAEVLSLWKVVSDYDGKPDEAEVLRALAPVV